VLKGLKKCLLFGGRQLNIGLSKQIFPCSEVGQPVRGSHPNVVKNEGPSVAYVYTTVEKLLLSLSLVVYVGYISRQEFRIQDT
jgi:hypothetical protein